MLEFCDRNKGAISVFLTMILLPVLLLGGLTVDAARIYSSKVVISDAGELAMNAALAQYEEKLHDEYGLLVMAKDPESVDNQLEELFNRSLNGTGLTSAEEYDKILDLMTEQFDAINLAGSEIYRTEVEKQQIVEYMKYRAPACLTETLLDKLEVLQETKKMADAMVAQMDFAESMEDCQDSMEAALAALKILDEDNQNFPSRDTMQSTMDSAQMYYKQKLSKYMVYLAAISKFNETASGDPEGLAESCIGAADGIFLDGDLENCFDSYLNAVYYQRGFEAAGGVGTLRETIGEAPDEEADPEGYESWKRHKDSIEDLIDRYESAQGKISSYPPELKSAARSCISSYYTELHGYYEKAVRGAEDAENANVLLKAVKENLEKAKEEWEKWDEKTGELSNPGEMPDEVDKYREFFGNTGTNEKNVSYLEVLMEKVTADQQYYKKVMEELPKEKFHGKSLTLDNVEAQYNSYYAKAGSYVTEAGLGTNYDAYVNQFKEGYQHVSLSPGSVTQITEDDFYKQLQEYCSAEDRQESKDGKEQADAELDKAEAAGAEAENMELDEDFPNYQWEITGTMPSALLGFAEVESANDKMTDVGGSTGNSSKRKAAVGKFRDSISETSSFLSKVDELLTNNLQNLYVAEYAMQILSYYTSNVKDGEKLDEEQVIGMSGYKIKEHKAYLAEVEYVLWGNPSSRTNVNYTMMTIFGIRILFNSFFAFTNGSLIQKATRIAITVSGPAPYLKPIIQVLVQLGYAGWETSEDIKKIKEGYGVTIVKTPDTWASQATGLDDNLGDNTKEPSMDYSEFLRLFLNLNMLAGNGDKKLARIGDCIAVNTGYDMSKGYTMVAVEAKVKARTTFMKTISDMGSGRWSGTDNTYSIRYQSILGY